MEKSIEITEKLIAVRKGEKIIRLYYENEAPSIEKLEEEHGKTNVEILKFKREESINIMPDKEFRWRIFFGLDNCKPIK